MVCCNEPIGILLYYNKKDAAVLIPMHVFPHSHTHLPKERTAPFQFFPKMCRKVQTNLGIYFRFLESSPKFYLHIRGVQCFYNGL